MQTEEERIRYDRQVRLWGANAQQQICATQLNAIVASEVSLAASSSNHTARLSTTPSGMMGEVCKNLVLAGIRGITLEGCGVQSSRFVFDGSIHADDLASNFYIRGDDEAATLATGKLRHTAMASMMKDLNPFVNVGEGESASGLDVNAVLIENINLVELAAYEESSFPTFDSPNPSRLSSAWGVIALGRYVVVLESTAAGQREGGLCLRTLLRKRLCQLFDSLAANCCALPSPALTVGIVLNILKTVLASADAWSRGGIVCLAHAVALDTWGMALTPALMNTLSEASSMALEVLSRAGYVIAADEDDATVSASLTPLNPCPSVVDASVAGGLIAQRIINAISAEVPLDATENIYVFSSSGPTVEAFVCPWPSRK